jgi:hypothetical protein
MNAEHKATLQMLVPMVVQVISEKKNMSVLNAIKLFYASKLYEKLEMENTKVWHYSPHALYDFLEIEIKTGKLEFPAMI